ncbi:RNA-directed DNA polymerase, eukaryota [Tanacetum coccineum]
MDFNFTNENDPWEYSLDIDDFDIHLTPVLRSSSSAHVEPSPYTPNPVTIIPGPAGVVQLSNSICVEPSYSTPNPVRKISGPAGLVQRAKLLKENVFILYPDGALMSTQEYMQKVVKDVGEDADFNSGEWEKLEQVVAIVKSCSPNALGDLNVTLKDLSGTVPGTIHYKVLDVGSYEKDITVGAAMILANFSKSFREEQSPVEEIEEIQVPVTQKKTGRRCQTAPKKKQQKEKVVDQRCIPWTPEEETALCKGWVRISKDSVKGNMRNERGFWIEILNVASDADYLQRALINYQAEYGVSFILLHCWEVLKESEKWRSGEVPLFMKERNDGKNKRYKLSGSSLFNTKESGEESINLNTTVGDEAENEVEEVRRPKPMDRDQAKRKMKAGSASSASSFDVEALAKMMANEYVMANDPYNIQKNQEMSELLKIKKQELKLNAAELEIRRMENRQRDEALYETTTDEALKERLRQRLFG